MRRVVVAAVMGLVAANAQAGNIVPGTYYCVTDRMVGIQPQGEAAEVPMQRVAGAMVPRNPTFAVVIEAYTPNPDGGDCLKGGPTADLACRTAQWVARLPDDKADMFSTRLYARDNPNVFHAGTAIFWMAANGSYSLARLFGDRGNSVEEGRCQTLEW